MWKQFREIIGLAADLAGLVAIPTLIYSYMQREAYIGNIWATIGVVGVVILAVMIAIRLVLKFSRERTKKIRELNVENQIINMKKVGEASEKKKLSDVLPSTSLLQKMKKMVDEDAREWAEDARCYSFNFYIDYKNGTYSLTVQAFYYSTWKDMTLDLYIRDGVLSRSDIEEKKSYVSGEIIPFYMLKGWRQAAIKVHEKLVDKLGEEYRIQYGDLNSEKMSVNYRFKESSVKRTIGFYCYGDEIKEIKK